MIDEQTLTDAGRCPACAAPLLGATCVRCGVDLSGPTGHAVWQLSLQAAAVLAERARLLGALQTQARGAVAPPAGPDPAPPASVPPASAPVASLPAPEWTRRRVASLLLSLGVGLLAVAAVIFLAVSWSVLGIGARASVMAGCTVLAAGGTALAARRGLGATAEAVAALTVGLGLLDAAGARAAGLAGLDTVATLPYWAGALALVAAGAALAAAVVPTRAFRLSAAGLAQLPLPLLALHLADRSADHQSAVLAGGLTVAALLGIAAAGLRPHVGHDVAVVLGAGAALIWAAATAVALTAAYVEPGSVVAGTGLLLVLAAAAATTAVLDDGPAPLRLAGPSVATGLVVAASWAPVVDRLPERWWPAAMSAAALVVLAVVRAVPAAYRRPPAAVALVGAVLPGLAAVPGLLALAAGQLDPLSGAWDGVDLSLVTWGVELPVLLLAVAAALGVAAVAHRVRWAGPAAVPPAALAAVTLPVGLDASYPVALALQLGLAVVLVPAAAWSLPHRALSWRPWGTAALATGIGLLAPALVWSGADRTATLVALPVGAVTLALAAVLGPVVARLPLAAAAATVAVADSVAVCHALGYGVATGGLAAVVLAVAVLVADVLLRRRLTVVGAAAVVAATLGTALSALDPDRLWLALLAAGAAAAVVALRTGAREAGWVAGALLVASSWVRLALADVDAPEPYTVPAGVALVALGWWRRRSSADQTVSSWRAYATGLGLALGPSLVRAVTDAGTLRPALLGLAALVVVGAGVARRLQAPLLIGGTVLAVDAVVQLSPYLLAVYDAVPRWTLLAAAGLLLLGVGATYERRARELRALQQQISAFG